MFGEIETPITALPSSCQVPILASDYGDWKSCKSTTASRHQAGSNASSFAQAVEEGKISIVKGERCVKRTGSGMSSTSESALG